ncbi:MAG: hypothetical protein HYT62_02250 [Candidatus Yanofskybacteria bacterium]|nr:hypothetical protein [Candidatus Yanofskybacteria bacterium]
MEAGALGAGAGALAGYGSTRNMRNRNKANAIGAVSTIGGGLLAGWLASRRSHDSCLTIEPRVARSSDLEVEPPDQDEPETTISPVVKPTAPIAGPAAVDAGVGEFELSNSTRMYVEAYDGQTYIGRMSAGATLAVGPPKDRYRGFALIPNRRGGLSKDEIEVEPGDSGWTFIEPAVAQEGRQ